MTVETKILSGHVPVENLFLNDRDLIDMRRNISQPLEKSFLRAYLLYVDGKWDLSKLQFEKFRKDWHLQMGYEDNPSKIIVDFMAESNFSAPDTWEGFRELREK